MIHFKDMSFCKSDCKVKKCHRKYTEKVKADARKWWGNENAPILLSDFSDGCPDFRK